MISILFGPGGSGKSLLQVVIVIRKLRFTQQNISTNLALDVPRLCEYCEEQYPNESLRITERLRILTVDETKEFWKHRGPLRYRADMMAEPELVYDEGKQGTCFIIDEAGAAGFNAQGWAQGEGRTTRGVECSWYLDQQRKFGDDVIASANGRAPTAIAKAFRDKAHEFVKLRNGYQRQMGIFKARGKFVAYYYASEPGPNVEHFKKEDFVLDAKGLASCYRTQDGVGVSGGPADLGRRAKGIPVLWVFPMAIGIGALCLAVPYVMAKGFAKAVNTKTAAVGKAVGAALPGSAVVEKQVHEPEAVWLSGYSIINGSPWVMLTDGRQLGPRDLRRVDRDSVTTVDGDVYRFRPGSHKVMPGPAVVVPGIGGNGVVN